MKTHEMLRKLRFSKKWSQEQMAEQLQLAKNTYARLERGESELGWKTAKNIVLLFGLDLNQLQAIEEGDLEIKPTITITNSHGNQVRLVEQQIINHQTHSSFSTGHEKELWSLQKDVNGLQEKIAGLERLLNEKDLRIQTLERENMNLGKMIDLLEKK